MFDLPTVTAAERLAAARFRNALLNLGFEMSQFSVYMRFCSSHAAVDTLSMRVAELLPQSGRVNILAMTDKQYERIQTYHGRCRQPQDSAPDQYVLF